MILDTKEQKDLLLEIIGTINISGKDIDMIYNLKQAIVKAYIKPIIKR